MSTRDVHVISDERETVSMHFVVVSGWTGAGKSTIADALARELAATVVSFDWVMSGLRSIPSVWAAVEDPIEHQRTVGWTLMSRVADQQLRRGASVIVDLVARDAIVEQWFELATPYGARLSVIECVCSDASPHQTRVEGRARAIPGWYELTWEQVQAGRTRYPPLSAHKLVLDSVNPVSTNLETALAYVLGNSNPK
jgi:predicted kinase